MTSSGRQHRSTDKAPGTSCGARVHIEGAQHAHLLYGVPRQRQQLAADHSALEILRMLQPALSGGRHQVCRVRCHPDLRVRFNSNSPEARLMPLHGVTTSNHYAGKMKAKRQ